MKKHAVLVVALFCLASGAATDASAALSAPWGRVEFDASGPGGMTIVGKTSALSVREENGAVLVTVALAGLDTGISLRNRHLHDKYLEVAKYPAALLAVGRSDLRFESGSARAIGQLTLHGRTKTVPFTYSVTKEGVSYAVTGRARIDIRDFGIEVPSYLGVAVKPEVDLVVSFVTTDR